MKLGYVNIHVISGIEHLITISAFVGQLTGEMNVFHMFHSTASITVNFVAKGTFESFGTRFWRLFKIGHEHGGNLLEV